MPDIEARFWKKYRDRGLVVIGIDPGGLGGTGGRASTDDIAGVQKFTQNLKVTFPVGLELTTNYVPFTRAFKGMNPFPVDVVVGREGNIAYIGREYDPSTLSAIIEAELAK